MSAQVFTIFALLACAAGAKVTPTEKVISLLEDLKTEVENDGQEEASIYDTFACFCQSMTEDKSENIKKEQDNVDTFNSDIETYTLTSKNKALEYQEKSTIIKNVQDSRASTESARAKVKETYELNLADLTSGIAGLETAIEMLEGGMQPSAAALAQMKSTVRQTVVVADLLELPHSAASKTGLAAFLQVHEGQAPPPNTGSTDIIVVMNELLTDFKEQKANIESSEGQAKSDDTLTMQALKEQEDSADEAKDDAERAKDEADGLLAEAKKGLEEEEAKLADDNLYLLDLTRKCELKAREFDQHAKARTEELEALSQATDIIKNKVKDNADESVKRAAFLQIKSSNHVEAYDEAVEDVAFVQLASTKPARAKLARLLQRGRAQESSEVRAARVDRAANALGEAGARIKSTVLTMFALKLRTRLAFDPFVKVRKLVQDLIVRLVDEANAEATKKGFCDVETAKAKHSRDVNQEEVTRINAETELAEAQKVELEAEIEEVTNEIAELEDALFKATKIRADEKAMNEETVSKSKAGLEAVNDAYKVLQDFYKKSAKNDVSLVQKASPIDGDVPEAPKGGAYKGGQQKAGGILAMLDVIISDFERTIRVTTDTEKNSLREFTEFDRTTKSSMAAKTSQKSNAEASLKATVNQITNNMDLLSSRMKMLDDTLRELEELVPTCVDTGMSYEERVQKREEEIEALKKAMCMLDGEDVEENCPP